MCPQKFSAPRRLSLWSSRISIWTPLETKLSMTPSLTGSAPFEEEASQKPFWVTYEWLPEGITLAFYCFRTRDKTAWDGLESWRGKATRSHRILWVRRSSDSDPGLSFPLIHCKTALKPISPRILSDSLANLSWHQELAPAESRILCNLLKFSRLIFNRSHTKSFKSFQSWTQPKFFLIFLYNL